jgi:hypothetical protein
MKRKTKAKSGIKQFAYWKRARAQYLTRVNSARNR